MSTTWPLTNKAYFYPFVVHEPTLITKLGLWLGATLSNNFDVGIYDQSGKNKVVSTGSTAQSGGTANTCIVVDVTDTWLKPGIYWLAVAMNGTTGTVFRVAPNDEALFALGMDVYELTSAFALPADASGFGRSADTGVFVACPFALTGGYTVF